jgi:hypothetical protein
MCSRYLRERRRCRFRRQQKAMALRKSKSHGVGSSGDAAVIQPVLTDSSDGITDTTDLST